MLSVIIIAKNEQHVIDKCLSSIAWADEIIVLDSGSTDNTVNIAKKYTSKVFETDWKGYGVQKQRALTHATQEWVLNIDADEIVSDELKTDIIHCMKNNEADAYKIPIQLVFYGQKLKYSYSPSRHIRLFKRQDTSYSLDIVHEKICIPDTFRVKQLKNCLLHQSFQDLSHALYKVNRYSSYTAKSRLKRHKETNFYLTLSSSLWMFFRAYILQRGFLDGKAGFVLAAINAQGALYRGLKQIYKDNHLHELPDNN